MRITRGEILLNFGDAPLEVFISGCLGEHVLELAGE